jgi:hypothetical protein
MPDEGLDYLLAIFPKNGTNIATTYLGLFTSQTATTVPAATAVLATASGVTEATGGGYARQSIAAADWGANAAASPNGRKTTATQKAFPQLSASIGSVNGIIVATALTAGIGLGYANFDDGNAIVTQTNDIVRGTPTLAFGN